MIEIRELVIKATVVQDNAPGAAAKANPSANNGVTPQEEFINACLDKVDEIMRDKKER